MASSGDDDDGLFGPDVADARAPQDEPPPEVVGDPIRVWAWQFVNRWVLLPHQRPAALRELRTLIAAARQHDDPQP